MDWVQLETRSFWIVFVAAFLLVGAWETRHPNRNWRIASGKRWRQHFLLYLTIPIVRLAVTIGTPVSTALLAQQNHWGLLNQTSTPPWVGLALTMPLLDLVKYGMHRLFHAVPFLWPVHRVHHSDPDFDVSTSIRFHPMESILMQAADLGAIVLFGAPAAGVFLTGVVSNVVNVTQHANANLSERWEERIRPLWMTARVHRIHHSDSWRDEHTNFGEVFPWWDRLFGTYAWTPERGERMDVGLEGYQNEQSMGLLEMLLQPLKPERKS